MKVIVLGGGVVGVTTAYQLQKDGHEVVIVERQPSRSGNQLGKCGHDRARAFLCLVLAQSAHDSAEIAGAERSGVALQALGRPGFTAGRGVPDGMHIREGAPQYLLKHRLAAYSQRVLQDVSPRTLLNTTEATAESCISIGHRKRWTAEWNI